MRPYDKVWCAKMPLSWGTGCGLSGTGRYYYPLRLVGRPVPMVYQSDLDYKSMELRLLAVMESTMKLCVRILVWPPPESWTLGVWTTGSSVNRFSHSSSWNGRVARSVVRWGFIRSVIGDQR